MSVECRFPEWTDKIADWFWDGKIDAETVIEAIKYLGSKGIIYCTELLQV